MERAPFSAFLLLLVGIVLLAQYVTGNLWTFLGELLGTETTPSATPPKPVPSTQTSATGTGNRRGGSA